MTDIPAFLRTEAEGDPKARAASSKPDLSLLPPVALREAARAHAFGSAKYGRYNWRSELVKATVYTAAAMRHIGQWQDGEELDPESGANHLAHAIATLNIVLDAANQGTLIDNRPVNNLSTKET